ncbi:hypothetical protein ES703_70703 [subsurface metagenome]
MKSSLKILLMDLDIIKRRRPFPNLALMKLSAYHKAKGDQVFLNSPLFGYDRAYASCVFSWHAKSVQGLPQDMELGGLGVNLESELPAEIEHFMPDYNLYPDIDFSMGFTSRGCIRQCPWCIVPAKEGRIKPWASIDEFWDRRHRKIKLLDNNFLAQPAPHIILSRLVDEQVQVDFNQGLDIRLVDERISFYLSQVKAEKLRFSFDDIAYEKEVRQGVKLLQENGVRSRKLSFYVLYGFRLDDQAIERMKILGELNVDVYPMAYRGPDGKEPQRQVIYHGSTLWHGPYRNRLKFLRLVGRLPE